MSQLATASSASAADAPVKRTTAETSEVEGDGRGAPARMISEPDPSL